MRKQNVQLLVLMALFLVPPAAAYLLFYSDFRPASGANYGQLVNPARPIRDVSDLQTLDGGAFRFRESDRKWTLLFLGDANCDDICSTNLYKIQQVRLAQGKEIGRVRSVIILPLRTRRVEIERVRGAYPTIIVVLAQGEQYASLVKQFQNGDDPALQGPGRVYIVDPIGNIMMSYKAEADASGMRKDLKRLLRISQLG
jgi:hypothetical protein